ncbi:type ISP restriction/modification enzyme [Plantactinospora siamensis]|uniref:site-specific DNA-methyltransferase (adenine-specific) n=1 Tax=Plantactinospora siamensis TaxID=555372 RepID=A0ABV6NUA6_9ACTN
MELLRAVGREIGCPVRAHGEVRLPELAIRPDYLIDVDGGPVGYVELKAPGRGVPGPDWRPTARERKQWSQLQLLPNVLFTDGQSFAVYRWGELHGAVARLDGDLRQAGERLRPLDTGLASVLHAFLSWRPRSHRRLEYLVRDAARLCRLLRDEVLGTLRQERLGAKVRLFSDHLADWRTWLFPHLSEELFADAYAQTVTFGLLLARRSGIVFDGKELPTIGRELTKKHLLVGRALAILTEDHGGPSIEQRSVALQTLRRIVAVSDWTDWRTDTADHLYERFLELYDPAVRRGSGSYFTPQAVADFIVRFVDGLLREKLQRRLGLAERDVVVVDPAMGTGTFLLSVIARVANAVTADGGDQQAELRSLLGRLVGFERQIAPFAVAELRLHQDLAARGLEVADEKVRFYVTDTLDDPNVETLASPYVYRPIADSRAQAIKVKMDERVMVVLGNPPYLERAKTQGGLVLAGHKGRSSLLDSFRGSETGRLEFKLHNLNIYFWRWATWKVFEAHPEHPEGIVAFVCTSAFTTGPGFAGMREYLRRQADWGWIIDLSPEGHQPDVSTRVFPEVQQPLCIGVFGRHGTADADAPAQVRYIEISGAREAKFDQLRLLSPASGRWLDCPTTWPAPFRPASVAKWNDCVPLADLMPWQSPGITPNRTWVYAPDAATLRERWRRLAMAAPQDRAALMKETGDRKVGLALAPNFDATGQASSLAGVLDQEGPVRRVAFRSFDRQYVIADRRVVDRARPDLWATHGEHQIYATTLFAESISSGPAIVFAAEVPDAHHYMGHHGGKAIPAYRDAVGKLPNIAPGLLKQLTRSLGIPITSDDMFAYIAALTAHPGYARRFRAELRTPGLRVPLTADLTKWRQAVELGERLVWLHTYGERYVNASAGRPQGPPLELRPDVLVPIPGTPERMPERITYDEETLTLHVGDGALGPVQMAVWHYDVCGTQVVKKWFEYRSKKPRVRRSSPLNDIVTTRWDSTNDLRNLLAVLRGCVALEPRLAELLEAVLGGPLITMTDLEIVGILPPPRRVGRPVIETDPRLF